MKATHTRGPWITDSVNADYPHDIILGYQIPGAGFPVLVATVFADAEPSRPGDISITEADANARLIAASPDLLAACVDFTRELRDWVESNTPPTDSTMRELMMRCSTAIAKARGE